MRLSVNVTSYPERAASLRVALAELGRAADDAGVDTVWVSDHLLQADPNRSPDEAMLEAFTTLGYLACATSRVRLGTMVAAATYRAPALLIKAVTTLDVLSEGRAWLGVGAGYQQDEARAMGLDLPPLAERFERLEETLRLALAMFVGDDSPYVGRHYQLGRPLNRPGPVSPHLPVLVGGGGEQRTLRLVAEYADACNLFDVPDGGATIRRKLAVLDEHCAAVGRDPAQVSRTVSTWWPADEPVPALRERCLALGELGIDHAVVLRPTPWTPDDVAALAGVTMGA